MRDGRVVRWGSRLPAGRPVDRHELLLGFAAGKRVAHIGFVDEKLLSAKLAAGVWLHEQLAKVARSLVGLDTSAEGVRWAQEHGYESYCADVQDDAALRSLELRPFDAIIAGEVIEHLDAPGLFLKAMHVLSHDDTVLVVTTPNAYRLANILVPLFGIELVHPDHTSWQSASTLRQLHLRNGWRIDELRYYHTPIRRERGGAANVARSLKTLITKAVPHWSDGLAVVARPSAGSARGDGR